jgi:hypothetical protein
MDRGLLVAEMMAPLQSKAARVLLAMLISEAVKNKRCVVAVSTTNVALGINVTRQAMAYGCRLLEELEIAVRNPWRPGTWIVSPALVYDTSTRHGARQMRLFQDVLPKMRAGMALRLKGKLPDRMDKLCDEATGL